MQLSLFFFNQVNPGSVPRNHSLQAIRLPEIEHGSAGCKANDFCCVIFLALQLALTKSRIRDHLSFVKCYFIVSCFCLCFIIILYILFFPDCFWLKFIISIYSLCVRRGAVSWQLGILGWMGEREWVTAWKKKTWKLKLCRQTSIFFSVPGFGILIQKLRNEASINSK